MKIHEQANYYKNKAQFLEDELRRVLNYVSSEKFTGSDGMVNVSDIQLRINESLNELSREFTNE